MIIWQYLQLVSFGLVLVSFLFLWRAKRANDRANKAIKLAERCDRGTLMVLRDLANVAGVLVEQDAVASELLRDVVRGVNPDEWRDRAESILDAAPSIERSLTVISRAKAICAGLLQ